MPSRLIQRHDQFSKQLLDQPGNADAFLRERMPAAVVARLTAEPAVDRSESFIDPVLAEHRGDRVYALTLEDGQPVLVWTMVEHKSAPESDSLLQALTNLSGIAVRAATRRENPDGTVWMVPAPVYAMVLYHGARRWPVPTALGDAYGLPPEMLADGLLDFRQTLVNLGTIPDDKLSRHPPLQAGLLILKYATRDDDPWVTLERLVEAAAGVGLTVVVLVVRYLFKASDLVDRQRLRAVLGRILPGQEEDVVSIAAQEIMAESRAKGLAEGKAEGLAEGEARGKTEMLLRQLRRRFGALDNDIEERVRSANSGRLDEWSERILDARALPDVFDAQPH